MGEQIGGVGAFKKKFAETKQMLIQNGVEKPTTKEIIAALKKAQAQNTEGLPGPLMKGLQVERLGNQGIQFDANNHEVMRQRTGFRQFAEGGINNALSISINNLMQAISETAADPNKPNEVKQLQINQYEQAINNKKLQAEQIRELINQKIDLSCSKLCSLQSQCNDEIEKIQNDNSIPQQEKDDKIAQIKLNKTQNEQEIITNLMNEMHTATDIIIDPTTVADEEPKAEPSAEPSVEPELTTPSNEPTQQPSVES